MRTLPILLCAAALVSGPRAHAQQAPSFKPIEFVVGSCWIGTFPDGKQTDEHCFDWAYGRKFIRDHHVVRGGPPYEGETLYAWNPVDRQVVFTYWSSDGLTGTGSVKDTTDGAVFPQRYPTEKGILEMRTTWTRTGPDGFRALVTQREGDTWKTLWTMNFARKPCGGRGQPLATNPAHPHSAPRAST